MKKFLVFSMIFVTSAFAAEKNTTVEFELKIHKYVKNRHVDIKVPALNKALKKAGLQGLPETIVVNKNAKAYWNILMKRLDEAQKLSPEPLHVTISSGYYYEYPPICYRGKASDVIAVLDGMQDNFLTSEQGTLAIRYGKKKVVRSDLFKSEKTLREAYDENAPAEVAAYLDFDVTSDAVLVMSDLGPQGDGTELYATYIEPCK